MRKIVLLITSLVLVGLSSYGYYNYSQDDGGLVAIKGTNRVFHKDNCKFVEKANVKDLIFFNSSIVAVDLGYTQCKTCNPPYISLEEYTKLKAKQKILKAEEDRKNEIKKQEQERVFLQEQQELEEIARLQKIKVQEELRIKTEQEEKEALKIKEQKAKEDKIKGEELEKASQTLANLVPVEKRMNGDISKAYVKSHNWKKSVFTYTITGTVINSGDSDCRVLVKAIYYDKENNPIGTETNMLPITIRPQQIEGFKLGYSDNIDMIDHYELQIVSPSVY